MELLKKRFSTNPGHSRGMTLLELIIASSMLLILASAALPVTRLIVKRNKERELRRNLREIRNAIDKYKDLADRNLIRVELGSEGYPPNLNVLVEGAWVGEGNARKVRFLRKIPIDPMTGRTDWGLRSVQDDPTSSAWGGENVFDVYSRSQGIALEGTRYSEW